jgi:hypothetical protein
MKKTLLVTSLTLALFLALTLPNTTHAQSVKDRVLGLFRYFQGNGLAAVKKTPLSRTNGPVPGDGIVYSADSQTFWSGGGTDPETLIISSGTVTFTANAGNYHNQLAVSVQGGKAIFTVPNTITALLVTGGSATLATSTNNVLTVKVINISDPGYLDITNGGLIINYDEGTPIDIIKSYILAGRPISGFALATWSGDGIHGGIRSSSAALYPDTFAIGYAENKDLVYDGPYTTFMGQPADLTSVLVRFTQAADFTLDGKAGDYDVTMIGAFYDNHTPGKYWHQGDADYSGIVDDSDVTYIGATYNEALQVNDLVAQASPNSISLYWTKINTTGNTVVMKQIGAGAWLQLTTTANSTLTDSAVTPGTIYSYLVKGPNGAPSNIVEVKVPPTPLIPYPPSNVTATPVTGTQINLTWQDNSTNEVGFVIERRTGNGPYDNQVTVFQNVTSYSSTNLTPGTTYTYRIRAMNNDGNSTYSNEATATTPPVPVAPSNLSGLPITNTRIDLTWNDNSNNETGFILDRATHPFFTQNLVQTTYPQNTSSVQINGLTSGTQYYFRVRATNANGNSANSNTYTLQTP